MEKAGITIGLGKITDYLVVPVLKKFIRPIFCFQSIVDDFKEQNKKLFAIRERVETEVQRDRDNGLIIYDSVEKWLKEVNEEVMLKVQGMNELLEEYKSCFSYSWCPGWTCHYSFSKQLSEIAATMKTLCEEGGNSFSSLSHPPALQQDIIGSSSSAAFVHSRSSRSAFDQIMEALKRDDVNLIGLHGMAGAGKTTLAQQVGEEAKKFYNRVIMVSVSQHPQVRSMQGAIADFLGIQFDQQESDQGRAAKLQMRLKNGETILIILDDVWKEFNLSAVIGTLPSDSGCKILLTWHAQNQVHTQKNIQLGVLSEDEAWTLLKSITGVGDEARKHDVAKEALEECNNLPKAIVALGTVLNEKDVLEWRETLEQHNTAKFEIIDNLKEGVKKLSLRQDRVKTKMRMAKQNVEEIYPDVEKWLKDVETIMNDVEQFENELNQNRWCFDELGVLTKVEALATCVKDLHEEGNFDQVSHPTPLERDMRLLPSEDFLFSKASKSASDQILKALKTDGVNMIGLYGMGGIGKTTLASQVHNEVIRQNELVVMVTVSQKPDVRNMQDKIADFLDLELKNKTLDGRAIELKNRLKNKEIFIILDDVWKRFDLRSIGIALDDCKGCKILMTTRGRDVCSSMECQTEIQLHMFSEDESQNFFKKKAGLSNKVELEDVAKQIVAECKCLPIALETVGAALRRKGKDEWTEALEKLRNARLVDIIGVDNDEKNVYKCLRVSYDYLNDQPQGSEAQFILLLCSLFPEDYEIKAEDLTRYAFGMKLFEKVVSIEDARRKVRVTIRFLRDSCLLLDTGGEEYVKLHDAVRDVLLWIGGTEPHERNTFTVRDNVSLKDLIRKKSFQKCKALSFSSDVIPKFSKYSKLEFPNLEIVLIFIKEDHEFVGRGEGFFENMKALKVLDFRAEWFWWDRIKFAMPQSLYCLEYLRTLMLRNFECSNTSVLRYLGRLQILSLHACKIDCGVEVVSGLKKLRLLDLTKSRAERRMFNSDVIETLVKLEELYNCRFEKCNDEEGTSCRLSELKLPSNLVAMSVNVEDVRRLPTGFCFPNLQSYDIHIGIYYKPSSISQGRHLELRGDIKDESMMVNMCEKLFPTVQVFRLSNCNDLYYLPASKGFAQGFLQKLEVLEVKSCRNMEFLLKDGNVFNRNNSTVQILSLKILYLYDLYITHIWEGPARSLSLCNLTKVDIINCPKLMCIFSSPSLAASLQQLEILKVERCHNLEEIFSRGGSGDDDEFTCWCCFTNLRELKVSLCHEVKAIFPLMKSTGKAPHFHPLSHHCRLPKLQSIVLKGNGRLQHIWKGPARLVSLCNLTEVEIIDCLELICIFSSPSVATSLQQLEILKIERCGNLEEIFSRGSDDDDDFTCCCCFTNLRELKVSGCLKMKTIFPLMKSTGRAPHLHPQSRPCRLPKLERILVEDNKELEHILGYQTQAEKVVECPSLQVLEVTGCPKLETTHFAATQLQIPSPKAVKKIKLGHPQGEVACENDYLLTSPFKNLSPWNSEKVKCIQRGPTQNICFADLCQIKVIGCHKLKHLFATKIAANLPKLKRLIVQRCNELQEVIMVEDGKERENDSNKEVIAKVGFENLEVLHVSNCKKLKTVFSTFIPLPKLDVLLLHSNAVLESLFGQSGCACTSHWTRLIMLSVTGCPKLCTETTAIVKSQLQARSLTKGLSIINLSNIQGIEELVQFQRQDESDVKELQRYDGDEEEEEELQLLKLEELGDLERIWSGPTQDISFSILVALRVIGCSRLKQLFTTNTATSLHNLKLLSVERCHDLQKIIDEEEGNEENNTQSVQQLDFSNLRILRLIDLPKLISFCPISCNLVFTNLREKRLKVKGCSKPVTDFFSKQSYQQEEDKDEYDFFEDDCDFEGEDEEQDEFEFKDEDKHNTYKFACALLGLRFVY